MFDLLFLLILLISLIVILLAFVEFLRRRFAQAGKLLKGLGIGLAIYFTALAIVSLASPQRVVAVKEDRCFDDWCVAVENVSMKDELGSIKPVGVFYIITLKLSNHARGRAQRAGSVAVHLMDAQGNRYVVSPEAQAAFAAQYGIVPPLTSTIEVGEALTTTQVFDLPRDARDIVLTIEHPVGFSPGWFVIGDEGSLLHRPTIVRLP